ncbi:MAG: choice-of-anchor J domain-containing protein [Candidatus Aphodosoma sp.]
MNKKLSFLIGLVATLLCTGLHGATVEFGNRPVYGFFLSNEQFTNAKTGAYGFARQTFNSLGDNELLYELTGSVGIYAAAAADGIYYAVPYHFTSSMQEPTPLPLFSYNLYTGHVEEIGEWNTDGSSFKPSDMTYDMKHDRLLALGFDPVNSSAVYEVNRQTGKFTKLVSLPIVGGVIAADAFGRIFTVSVDGRLFQIDMSQDNKATELCSLPYRQLQSNQTLEFDITNNKLYWAANCIDNPSGDKGAETRLVEITMPVITPEQDYSPSTDFSYREIGPVGHYARFQGMYIPYATGGFMAPGFATDIKTTSSEDGTECTIEFKAPTTTFGGEALESVDGYDLYRNGVKIHTHKGLSAGENAVYTDTVIPASGEYRYDIVCYSNTNGDGPKSPAFAYVGFDRPEAVSNIAVEVGDDFKTISISWDAPAKGALGGTFDPTKTLYDIVRLPDNSKVAENLTEPQFTDNLRRLLRYSYRIEAKNDYGVSSAVSREFVAGTPISELPFEETFDYADILLQKWTPVDNNGDGMTWLFGTTLGQSVFGDYEMTAEYILSPTSVDASVKDADEWLISPPIAFGDAEYGIELQIRTLTPEHISIYVGDKNEIDHMEILDGFEVNQPQFNDEGRMLFQTYIIPLPESVRNSVKCVAVTLDTPLPANHYGYMQLGNVRIGDIKTLPVNEISDDAAVNVFCNGEALFINGEYAKGAIYSVNGLKLQDVKGEVTDISGLSAGVYILVVDNHSFKFVK